MLLKLKDQMSGDSKARIEQLIEQAQKKSEKKSDFRQSIKKSIKAVDKKSLLMTKKEQLRETFAAKRENERN